MAFIKNYFDENSRYMNRKVIKVYEDLLENSFTNIIQLNLSFATLGDIGCTHLATILPYLKNLKLMKCWKCKIGYDGLYKLAPGLATLSKL